MNMNVYAKILKLFKWDVNASGVPDAPKCVIVVAPHTSNWDFVLGYMAYRSIGREANFLMKSSWFFFPLGLIFKKMGGIPVYRSGSKKGSLIEQVSQKIKDTDVIHVALTPEGTRSATENWHTGFLRIAYAASVPIQLAVIDYPHKKITIADQFTPSGDIATDMQKVRDFYASYPDAAYDSKKFLLPDIDNYTQHDTQ